MTKIQKKRIREYFRLFDGPGCESKIKRVYVIELGNLVEVITWGNRIREGGYLVRSGRAFRVSYVVTRRGKELVEFAGEVK